MNGAIARIPAITRILQSPEPALGNAGRDGSGWTEVAVAGWQLADGPAMAAAGGRRTGHRD